MSDEERYKKKIGRRRRKWDDSEEDESWWEDSDSAELWDGGDELWGTEEEEEWLQCYVFTTESYMWNIQDKEEEAVRKRIGTKQGDEIWQEMERIKWRARIKELYHSKRYKSYFHILKAVCKVWEGKEEWVITSVEEKYEILFKCSHILHLHQDCVSPHKTCAQLISCYHALYKELQTIINPPSFIPPQVSLPSEIWNVILTHPILSSKHFSSLRLTCKLFRALLPKKEKKRKRSM